MGKLARASFSSFHFSFNSKCKNCNFQNKLRSEKKIGRPVRNLFEFPYFFLLVSISPFLFWFETNRESRTASCAFHANDSLLFAYISFVPPAWKLNSVPRRSAEAMDESADITGCASIKSTYARTF